MKIKNYLVLLLIVFSIIACEKDKEVSKSKEELLAGLTSKKWKLVELSDDNTETHESCKASAAHSMDNLYIFFKSNDFEFNNGEELGEECDECCFDMVDAYGKWTITADGYLVITLKGIIENGVKLEEDTDEEFANSRIDKLTESELVLTEQGITAKLSAIN